MRLEALLVCFQAAALLVAADESLPTVYTQQPTGFIISTRSKRSKHSLESFKRKANKS